MTTFATRPLISRLTRRSAKTGRLRSSRRRSRCHNPANQISSQTRDNDAYAFAQANQDVDETPNGLNQLVTQGGASLSYDAAGSLVSDGTNSYGYDAENRLISGSAYGVALRYDPLGRLWETASATFGTTRFLTDGAQVAVEYDGAGTIRRRFMFDDDSGAPVLQDDGGALNCGGTRFYQNDERGSAIALADCFGNRTAIDAYDDYGVPSNPTTAIGTAGRYRYTGQAFIPELGMYYYKARIYAPSLGRFMQTDPIGTAGGINLYAYVRGDPVNLVDPLGLYQSINQNVKPINPNEPPCPDPCITVTGHKFTECNACKSPGLIGPNADLLGPIGSVNLGEVVDRNKPDKPGDKDPIDTPECGSPQDGPVKFYVDSFTAVVLFGVTIGEGEFTTAGGGSGTFTTGGFALGAELGLSRIYGQAPDLATFTGRSDNISLSLPRAITLTGSRSESNGSLYGSGGAGLSPTKAKIGGSISTTDTDITSFTCKKKK